MKDLLSKEHYCYKFQTLLVKSSAYAPSIEIPPYMDSPSFLQENLIPPPIIFQKSQPHINKGGVQTM